MIQNMVQRPHHGLPEWPSNTPKSDTTAFLQLAPSRIARMQKIEYKSRILGVGRDAQCAVVMWLVQSKIKVGHAKQIAIGSHGNACICMGMYTYACVNQKHNVRNVYVIAKYREYTCINFIGMYDKMTRLQLPLEFQLWQSFGPTNRNWNHISLTIFHHTCPCMPCQSCQAVYSGVLHLGFTHTFLLIEKRSEPKKHSSHSESCWSFKRPCNKLVNNM